MNNDAEPNDVRAAWQAEVGSTIGLSKSDMRARIDRVARKTSRRTTGGLIVCALVLASLASMWWLVPKSELARAGILLIGVGIGTLAVQLMTHNDVDQELRRRMSEMGGMPSLEFHRWQLARQRDFHRGWRLWSRLLVLTPGPMLFFVGFAREHPEVARTIHLEHLAFLLLLAIAVPVNLRLARRHQDQLNELDHLSSGGSR